MRLPPLPSTNDILRLYHIRCKKQLSQNLLHDAKLSSKLVGIANRVKRNFVIEVGPGAGSLTRPILEQGAAHCAVIEKDPRFLPGLNMLREASGNKLSIHLGDARSFNMVPVIPPNLALPWEDPRLPPIHIVGNLPFNVATPLLFKWLRQMSLRTNAWSFGRTTLTLTFQKEFAERIVALPGDSLYRSRLSVMCQNWCDVKLKFIIPGTSFIPRPDVDVGVVVFTPLVKPIIPFDFSLIERVVYTIFSVKQKFCKNTVGYLFPIYRRKELAEKLVAVADVNPMTPSFLLSVEEFNRICHTYVAICKELPYLLEYNFRKGKLAEYKAIADQHALEFDLLESKSPQTQAEFLLMKENIDKLLSSDKLVSNF